MSALAVLLRHDLRLLRRYGIIPAYGVVVALYAAGLYLAADILPDWAIGLLIYSDPAVLGFFFLGAMMMLERAEGPRQALAITPISGRDYVLAKVLALSALALGAVLVLGLLAPHARLGLLLGSVALISLCYCALGVLAGLRFKTVGGYLMGSAAILTPVILPGLLAFLNPMPGWAILLPPAAQLRLVLVAVGGAEAGTGAIAAMFAVLAVSAALALWVAIGAMSARMGRA